MPEVIITLEAQRQFLEQPIDVQTRMNRIFERLAAWPNVSGAKPLRHALAGQYRIRTGDYRVQFRVERKNVVVVKIGHRDRFYED